MRSLWMDVRLWTEEWNVRASSSTKCWLHGAAAFAGRNGRVFGLDSKRTLANIQPLLHHIWDCMRVVEHLVVRQVSMCLTERLVHLHLKSLLLRKREEGWVVRHVLKPWTVAFARHFPCSNPEPLHFLFQCLVQCCEALPRDQWLKVSSVNKTRRHVIFWGKYIVFLWTRCKHFLFWWRHSCLFTRITMSS